LVIATKEKMISMDRDICTCTITPIHWHACILLYRYTGPFWWLLADFIPRVLPTSAFMFIMFGSILRGGGEK